MATSEILRAISRSQGDIQAVFEAIVESTAGLCEAQFSGVARFEDGQLHLVAINNMSPGEGTGLGLSISYDIVTQQHGGTITVDSRIGDFTEFTIRLPHGRHETTTGKAT
jgi:light-regulated signal transduction histidine kinase (bacteriophytochrome)